MSGRCRRRWSSGGRRRPGRRARRNAASRPSPESSRPEPVRGGAPRGDMLRGDMPPAGSRGDFDRAGFDAPDAGQRGRQDRGRPERGRGEPGAAPLPSPAAHGDAGEAEAAARQDLYGAPVAMPFRAPRKGSRCRMTCPAAVTRAAVAVRSRPVTRKPTGRSRRRVPVALRARTAPQAGGVRRPVTTPAASGAPRNLPGTARAARSRSAGKRSTSIAGESPHPARSAATAARRRDRPGPARRARSRGLTPTRLPVRGGARFPGHSGPAESAGAGSARAGPARRTGPAALRPAAERPLQRAPADQCARTAAGPVSLTGAVQSAHEEGEEFGESVAREAPALWLEAVLARKPRMPSDLEARLLQGSALPIDFLLHDEVPARAPARVLGCPGELPALTR